MMRFHSFPAGDSANDIDRDIQRNEHGFDHIDFDIAAERREQSVGVQHGLGHEPQTVVFQLALRLHRLLWDLLRRVLGVLRTR